MNLDAIPAGGDSQKPRRLIKLGLLILRIRKQYRFIQAIASPFLAMLFALVFGAILIKTAGENPITAYGALWDGAFGSGSSILRVLRWTGPLIISGLASAVAFRAGIFNTGVEGSLWIGGLAASLTGIYITGLPMIVHIPLVFIAGGVFGGLWALGPAIAKAKYAINEVVSTLMLNYIAILLVQYLIRYHFFHIDPTRTGMGAEQYAYPETDFVQASAQLPWLNAQHKLSIAILIAVSFVILMQILFRKSKWGFESKVTGINHVFSKFGGINTIFVLITAMVISGALGGIVGSLEVTGNYHRFISTMAVGLGFDGIAIAMMGKLNPIGILISAILLAALKVGGAAMERGADVSRNIVVVIQGLVLLFVTAENIFSPSGLFNRIKLSRLIRPKEAHG